MEESEPETGGSEDAADSALSGEPGTARRLRPGSQGPWPEPKAESQPTEPSRRPTVACLKLFQPSSLKNYRRKAGWFEWLSRCLQLKA